jgi:hypothetical protein
MLESLPPQERREVLLSLPVEERLAGPLRRPGNTWPANHPAAQAATEEVATSSFSRRSYGQ